MSLLEYVGRYLARLGEAAAHDALKVRLFSLYLSGSVFSWFTSLPPDSVRSWDDLEKKFHAYFFTGVAEISFSDLAAVR